MRARWIVLAVLMGCHPAPTRVPRDTISLHAWDQAQAIVEQYSRDHDDGWLLPGTTRDRRWGTPYLFVYKPTRLAFVVHHGRVITERGLPALQRYLDETKVLERQLADGGDLAHLLDALGVELPVESYLGADQDAPPDLEPTVRYRGRRADLSLFSRQGAGAPAGDPGAPDPEHHDIDEWILRLEPGRAPRWWHRARDYNLVESRFNDHVTDAP